MFDAASENWLFSTVLQTSDEEGRFAFEVLDDEYGVSELAMWASTPRHEPSGLLLASIKDWETSSRVIDLVRAEHLEVTVVRGDAPVGGVLVEQFAHATTFTPDWRMKFAFRRQWWTDDHGRVKVAPFTENHWLRAVQGNEASAPWYGGSPDNVTLELGGEFTALGRVTVEQETTLDGCIVRCALPGDLSSTLAMHAVRKNGEWGPASLPTSPPEIVFRLEGGNFQPQEVQRSTPPAGRQMRVDFEPEPGLTISVLVRDGYGAAIPGAMVQALWHEDGEWDRIHGSCDESGVAKLGGCRPGAVWIRASKDGYIKWTSPEPTEFYTPNSEPYLVELQPGGSISGTCTHGGVPVKEFSVAFWQQGPQDLNSKTFSDEEGRFQVDDVPFGRTYLYAYSSDVGVSDVVEIYSEAGSTTTVVIELPEPVRVIGQVINTYTGEPVPLAKIEPWKRTNTGQWIDNFGDPVTSRHDGRFEIAGLCPGRTSFSISAPGYMGAGLTADVPPVSEFDIGTLNVAPEQQLLVQLVHGDESTYGQYQASVHGSGTRPFQPFDEGGLTVFEGLTQGGLTVRVLTPESQVLDLSTELCPGQPWLVEVDVGAPSEEMFQVRVDALPEVLETIAFVVASGELSTGEFRSMYVSTHGGTSASIPGPFGLEATVMLQTFRDERLVFERVSVEEWRSGPVVLRPGEPYTLEVVDGFGRRLSDAAVRLTVRDDSSGWSMAGVTDEKGRFDFYSQPRNDLFAHVSHPEAGSSSWIPLELADANQNLLRIVLEASSGLVVTLLDGETPLSGIVPLLDIRRRLQSFGSMTVSDRNGRSESCSLAPGEYVVTVSEPGYWLSTLRFELGPEPQHQILQVRRLGSMRFQAVDSSMRPVSGVRLNCFLAETGEDLDTWVSQGRVSAPDSGLVTGSDGTLSIVAVPNGEYQWEALAPGSKSKRGSLVVPPSGVASVVIEL